MIILAGNAWLCFALIGLAAPDAVSVAFASGITLALIGGAGLAALTVRQRFAAPSSPSAEDPE